MWDALLIAVNRTLAFLTESREQVKANKKISFPIRQDTTEADEDQKQALAILDKQERDLFAHVLMRFTSVLADYVVHSFPPNIRLLPV